MFLHASVLVNAGFVVLPMLLGSGFVLAGDWAGRRLGETPTSRRRWAIGTGLAVLLWLLVTAAAAASGVLQKFDVRLRPSRGCCSRSSSWGSWFRSLRSEPG